MLWFESVLNRIVLNINQEDIAFFFASSIEINKEKRSKLKAQKSLECLSHHRSFSNCVLEFFLKGRKDSVRCVAIDGVEKNLKDLYYGRKVDKDSSVYEAFSANKVQFKTNIDKERGRRGELLRKSKAKSSLLMPIANFGVLALDRLDSKKFTDYEIKLLKNFCEEIIKPSLELALDNEKNFNAAIRDQLTGIYNHGYFMLQIERELSNAKRGSYPVSLIMIDVDYFKHYNDLNGHLKGDKVLAEVGRILKYNTRKGDMVARYGGEEFAVLLFNAELKIAEQKADKLRTAVSQLNFFNEKMQPNNDLTISLGVASFPFNAECAKDLIERADKALYLSKKNGKNRVTVYENKV